MGNYGVMMQSHNNSRRTHLCQALSQGEKVKVEEKRRRILIGIYVADNMKPGTNSKYPITAEVERILHTSP